MALEKLLKVQERLWAPEDLRKKANLQDYAAEYRKSLEDPEGFEAALLDFLSEPGKAPH